jgi:hypothetical protein
MTWKELIGVLATGRHHYDPDLLERSPLGLKRFAAIARDYRRKNPAKLLGQGRTHDTVTGTAIQFRMPAGFPGAVNRSHPVSIEPCLIDASAPPTLYGQGVVVDPTTQGVRPLATADQTLTDVYGVTVRPFPLQQNTTTPSLYTATPPIAGVIDVMRNGYIMIGFNVSGSAPVKGGSVYIWTAATSGAHIQGSWETANPTTNGMACGTAPRTTYQGGWDANNVGELAFHE